MSGFKVAVTVTHHKTGRLWNRVHMWLDGDKTDLRNLQKQLNLVKADVNRDMNKYGAALRDVDVKVEFV